MDNNLRELIRECQEIQRRLNELTTIIDKIQWAEYNNMATPNIHLTLNEEEQ